MDKKQDISVSDALAFSALTGAGLALLFGFFIPMILSNTGGIQVYEHIKAVLYTETALVVGVTVLGGYKLVTSLFRRGGQPWHQRMKN
jgi:hypothetical protein